MGAILADPSPRFGGFARAPPHRPGASRAPRGRTHREGGADGRQETWGCGRDRLKSRSLPGILATTERTHGLTVDDDRPAGGVGGDRQRIGGVKDRPRWEVAGGRQAPALGPSVRVGQNEEAHRRGRAASVLNDDPNLDRFPRWKDLQRHLGGEPHAVPGVRPEHSQGPRAGPLSGEQDRLRLGGGHRRRGEEHGRTRSFGRGVLLSDRRGRGDLLPVLPERREATVVADIALRSLQETTGVTASALQHGPRQQRRFGHDGGGCQEV